MSNTFQVEFAPFLHDRIKGRIASEYVCGGTFTEQVFINTPMNFQTPMPECRLFVFVPSLPRKYLHDLLWITNLTIINTGTNSIVD